jgi:hypothetical protein
MLLLPLDSKAANGSLDELIFATSIQVGQKRKSYDNDEKGKPTQLENVAKNRGGSNRIPAG